MFSVAATEAGLARREASVTDHHKGADALDARELKWRCRSSLYETTTLSLIALASASPGAASASLFNFCSAGLVTPRPAERRLHVTHSAKAIDCIDTTGVGVSRYGCR